MQKGYMLRSVFWGLVLHVTIAYVTSVTIVELLHHATIKSFYHTLTQTKKKKGKIPFPGPSPNCNTTP